MKKVSKFAYIKGLYMDTNQIEKLIDMALEAREKAYAPYSDFRVGAALVTSDGFYYSGCNVENASYGATNCAERTAIFKAVSEGHTRLKAIAIVGGMDKGQLTYAYPCGVCRQVMREFADDKGLAIIVARSVSDYKSYTLKDLLPESFGPDFRIG